MVLHETGLLPHVNAGVLTRDDFAALKTISGEVLTRPNISICSMPALASILCHQIAVQHNTGTMQTVAPSAYAQD